VTDRDRDNVPGTVTGANCFDIRLNNFCGAMILCLVITMTFL